MSNDTAELPSGGGAGGNDVGGTAAAAATGSAPRRGGYSRRGGFRGSNPRGGSRHHNQQQDKIPEDESDAARELRQKYPQQLSQLKMLFQDWTDEELLFVLQDAAGEVELAVGLISEGEQQSFSSSPECVANFIPSSRPRTAIRLRQAQGKGQEGGNWSSLFT